MVSMTDTDADAEEGNDLFHMGLSSACRAQGAGWRPEERMQPHRAFHFICYTSSAAVCT